MNKMIKAKDIDKLEKDTLLTYTEKRELLLLLGKVKDITAIDDIKKACSIIILAIGDNDI